jgi:hypothetical protein
MSHRARTWCDEITAPSPMARHVLSVLCDMANALPEAPHESEHVCWPSVSHLVKVTQWSERGIRKALKDLEEAGLIRSEARADPSGRIKSNAYWMGMPADFGTQRGTVQTGGVGARGAPTPAPGAPTSLHHVHPLNLNKNHKEPSRGARVRPEGRTPRACDTPSHGTGEGVTVEPLLADLDTPVDREAFDAWAGLVLAVVKRREQDLARAWLSRQAGVCVHPGKLIMASKPFTKERIEQAFGGLLREHGWQVAVAGSG